MLQTRYNGLPSAEMTRIATRRPECHLQVGGKGPNLREGRQVALKHLQLTHRHA